MSLSFHVPKTKNLKYLSSFTYCSIYIWMFCFKVL